MAYCVSGGRVCPTPLKWNKFWEALPDRRRGRHGWEPPPPLILSQWWFTNDAAKRQRLKEHVRWAFERGALAQVGASLRALPLEDWHCETPPDVIPTRRAGAVDRRERIEQEHEASRAARRAIAAEHGVQKREADERYRASFDPALLEAYRTTAYHVFAEPPFVLRIGAACPALVALLNQERVGTAAFVTAWNPFGDALAPDDNLDRQAKLIAEVDAAALRWIGGEGRGAGGDWPPEPSILILGLSRRSAKVLGRSHGQNAIVWADADAVPELVLLRPSH